MARAVKLTRLAADTSTYNNYGAYRLRIEVAEVSGADLDEYLFIYRAIAPSAYTGQNCDVFEAVAGPSQLAAYPAGAANPDQGWPYYRLNYVELDVISATQADSIWKEIQKQVCVLVAAMDKLDNLQVVEHAWCPESAITNSQSSQG